MRSRETAVDGRDMRQHVDHAFAVRFADRWHSAWNTHDPDRVAALCHADIVVVQSASADRHCREGVADSVRELFTAFDDYRFESVADPLLAADGLRVVVGG